MISGHMSEQADFFMTLLAGYRLGEDMTLIRRDSSHFLLHLFQGRHLLVSACKSSKGFLSSLSSVFLGIKLSQPLLTQACTQLQNRFIFPPHRLMTHEPKSWFSKELSWNLKYLFFICWSVSKRYTKHYITNVGSSFFFK